MKQVTNITDIARQKIILPLDNGEEATLTLEYMGLVLKWKYTIEYNDIIYRNQVIKLHFNILNNWRKILPFGLLVRSEDSVDPFLINDFVIQSDTNKPRVYMYILNENDLTAIDLSLSDG